MSELKIEFSDEVRGQMHDNFWDLDELEMAIVNELPGVKAIKITEANPRQLEFVTVPDNESYVLTEEGYIETF